MADPNNIKLSPIDQNSIVVEGDAVWLEQDPFLPSDYEVPAGIIPVGGNDVKATAQDLTRTEGKRTTG